MFGHSGLASRLLLAGALVLFSAAAHAQVRYVATTGNDGRPCTIAAAPCRTLQRGIDAAPAGGEVRVLDSGDYGSPTIGKPLTVSGDNATIFVGQITISGANAIIALRGLSLHGTGDRDTVQAAVVIATAAAVHIESCTIANSPLHGIYFTAPNAHLFVTNSTLRDNAAVGLYMYDENATDSDFGSMRLTVDGSRIENNGTDGAVIQGGTSTFTHSIVSGNQRYGISLLRGAGSITSTASTDNVSAGYLFLGSLVTMESSTAQGSNEGVRNGSTLTISNSVFTNNSLAGIRNDGGTVRTRGNNTVVNNGTDVSGALTPLGGK